MSEWKEVKLGEICSYGKERIGVASLTSATYISTENMQPNRGGVVLASSIPDKGCVVAYKKDDVLVSNIRPYFKKIWQASHDGGCSADVLVFRNRENVNAKFLYYSLSADSFFDYSMATAKGTKMPRGDKNSLMEYGVKLPPLAEQCRIAEILGSLDDKIELNNAITKNLEEQAQALFKNWFVDFAPFGGVMPEEWKKGKLGNFVEIKRGGSPRPIQDFLSDTGYRWLKISDVTSLQSPFVLEIAEHIKESGLNKTVFLKAGSLVLSNSATPGIPKILDLDTCIHDGWLYFTNSELSNEFLYLFFNEIRKNLVNLGNGSIFTNLKTEILKNYDFALPSKEILKSFQKLVESLFAEMLNIQRENQQLKVLRDSLLTKLMSGEQ